MSFIGDLERLVATNLYPLRVPIAIGLAIGLVVVLVIARRRGWGAAARRHPGRTGLLVIALLVLLGPAAWYLGSPLFIRVALEEPVPSPVAAAPTIEPSPWASDPGQPTAGPTATPATEAPTPTPVPERTGQFVGADDFHFGSGTARLIETAPGTWVVRFEDFSVRNGPDLYVYLSPKADGYGKGAIELGRLRATDGNFNTPIPAGTDLGEVRSVVIWCKAFAVQFAHATFE